MAFICPQKRQVRNIVKRYGSVIREKTSHPHTFPTLYATTARNGWGIKRLQQVLGIRVCNVAAFHLYRAALHEILKKQGRLRGLGGFKFVS